MKKIWIHFLFLYANLSPAQTNYNTYYDHINLAEKFMLANQYYAADSCFRIAFTANPKAGYNLDYLTASFNAAKLNDSTAVDLYLLGFAKRGGNYAMLKHSFNQNLLLEENSKALLLYIMADRKKQLRTDMKKAYKRYAITVNPSLIKKVKRMYVSDQKRARGFFVGLLPAKKQTKIMNKADSKHARQLLEICKVYGWPGFDLLGEYREYGKFRLEKIDVLLRHFSSEDLERLKPYIISSIKSLNYYPSIWAGCLDYNELKNPVYNKQTDSYEMKQSYGTLSQLENGQNALIPYGKMNTLISYRKELFLADIEDYCKIRKITHMPTVECIIIKKASK
jgi:hypothetical protein